MKNIKVKKCRTCPHILYDDGKGFASAFWIRQVNDIIEQDVFGTLTNSARLPELTLEDVEKAVDEINKSRTIYYRVSNHTPKTNEENERIVYFFEHTGEFALHPDDLPDFVKALECAGYVVRDVKTLSSEEQIQRIKGMPEGKLNQYAGRS